MKTNDLEKHEPHDPLKKDLWQVKTLLFEYLQFLEENFVSLLKISNYLFLFFIKISNCLTSFNHLPIAEETDSVKP